MRYFSLDVLSQLNQSFTGKVFEEADVIKEYFVSLDSVLRLNAFGKRVDNLVLFIKGKELFDLERFFDKVDYFRVEFV